MNNNVKRKKKEKAKPISKIQPTYNNNLTTGSTLWQAPFAASTAFGGGFNNEPNYNQVTLEDIILKLNEVIERLNT